MAKSKKVSTKEVEVLEEDVQQPLFKNGDYYTALLKVDGKKQPVKIRGKAVIIDNIFRKSHQLFNNQAGDDVDCDNDITFSFVVELGGNTQADLDEAGIKEFSIVTDRRVKRVIDNDQLPEIADYQARKRSDGTITFGCGSVEYSKEDIAIWLKFMEKIRPLKDSERFFEMMDEINSEVNLGDVLRINLKDVRRLLE